MIDRPISSADFQSTCLEFLQTQIHGSCLIVDVIGTYQDREFPKSDSQRATLPKISSEA